MLYPSARPSSNFVSVAEPATYVRLLRGADLQSSEGVGSVWRGDSFCGHTQLGLEEQFAMSMLLENALGSVLGLHSHAVWTI